MIWEIIKKGWNSWRSHKISSVPFFIRGVISTALLIGAVLFVVYTISPEVFEFVQSGNITEEYVTDLILRYKKNIDFILLVAVAALFLYIISDSFFRVWGIKLCSDSLQKPTVSLRESFRYARSRYPPFVVFSLAIQGAIFTGLIPLYYIFRGIVLEDELSAVSAAALLVAYILIWSLLVVVLIFITTFAPYAIVLGGEGVLGGIRKGFRVLSNSLSETVIMWLFVALAGMALNVPFYFLKFLGPVGVTVNHIITPLLSWLVLWPITTMWWIELYRRKTLQL